MSPLFHTLLMIFNIELCIFTRIVPIEEPWFARIRSLMQCGCKINIDLTFFILRDVTIWNPRTFIIRITCVVVYFWRNSCYDKKGQYITSTDRISMIYLRSALFTTVTYECINIRLLMYSYESNMYTMMYN